MKKPWTARDWRDAIAAQEDNQVHWFANNPSTRAVINDRFEHYLGTTLLPSFITPLSWAIQNHCPLKRIRFLVEHAGAIPSNESLSCAIGTDQWPIVKYLHDNQGARHEEPIWLTKHLTMVSNTYGEEASVALVLEYPEFWNYIEQNISWRLIELARYRRERARQAAVSIIGLRKKRPDLACKDTLKIVAREVLQYDSMASERWGHPSEIQSVLFFAKKEWFFTILVFGILCLLFLIIGTMGRDIMEVAVGQNCVTTTCPATSSLGPQGPPGLQGPPGVFDNIGILTINGISQEP